jgi:hypothetical protein
MGKPRAAERTALSWIELTRLHPMDRTPFAVEQWVLEFKYDGYRILANSRPRSDRIAQLVRRAHGRKRKWQRLKG